MLRSKQRRETGSLEMLVVRECFLDAMAPHHGEREMIYDPCRTRVSTMIGGPRHFPLTLGGDKNLISALKHLAKSVDLSTIGAPGGRASALQQNIGCGDKSRSALRKLFEGGFGRGVPLVGKVPQCQ